MVFAALSSRESRLGITPRCLGLPLSSSGKPSQAYPANRLGPSLAGYKIWRAAYFRRVRIFAIANLKGRFARLSLKTGKEQRTYRQNVV